MSRELDARVAEAMGYRWWRYQYGGRVVSVLHSAGATGWAPSRGGVLIEGPTPRPPWDIGDVPKYSTDPAACEEVKKEIRKLWWRHEILWRVPISPLDKNPAHYKCFVQGESGIHQAVATTEYEAICLAFLAAVEAVEAEKGAKQ